MESPSTSDMLPSTALPSLDSTYGAYIIGTFLGLVLYGLVLHQTYRYFRLFPTDTHFIRLLVVMALLTETTHCVFTMHTCYYYLVTNYFDPFAMLQGIWSINYTPIVVGVNMFISQLFFVRRVFLMGHHYRIIAGVALFIVVLEVGVSIAACQKASAVADFSDLSQVNHIVSGTFGSALVGDILLTRSLIWVLRRSHSTGFSKEESTIETLMTYIIYTGLLHGLLNIVSLCLSLVYPDNLAAASLSIVTTRLYANTLLAVLNSRKLHVARGLRIWEAADLNAPNIISRAKRLALQENWNVPQVPEPAPSAISINVTTERHGTTSEPDHSRDERSEGDGSSVKRGLEDMI